MMIWFLQLTFGGWLKQTERMDLPTQETLVDGLPNDVHSLDISDNDYDGMAELNSAMREFPACSRMKAPKGFSIDHSYDSYEDFHIHQHDLNDDGTPRSYYD